MKKTILITRPTAQSAKLAKQLEKLDLNVIIEPIFDVEFLDAHLRPQEFQAIIITSANACAAIISNNFAKDVKIFAVGKKTATPLVTKGYNNIFYPKISNAQNLQELIIAHASDKKLLYFCGPKITLDFSQTLQPHGFEVKKIPSYKINWHPSFSPNFLHKIATKNPPKIDYILLYSQNSAQNFYNLMYNHNLLEYFAASQLVCISDKIATSLKNLGVQNKIKIFAKDFSWLK